MRPQVLLHQSRSLIQQRATSRAQRVLFSNSEASRLPRRESRITRATSRSPKCASNSSTHTFSVQVEEPTPLALSSGPVPPEDPNEDDDRTGVEAEKTKRTYTRRTRVSEPEKEVPLSLPPGLDVLWSPDSSDVPSPSALPPQEIFQDVLTNLLISLHPQTQHRGAYTSSNGPPIEPTLALYCPIEGGDYIIDETVRELARRTDSDVVVLDAAQLAAGEWGAFGKAATALQLPQNPLQFRPPVVRYSPSTARASEEEYDDDDDDYSGQFMPSHMTLHVLSPERSFRSARSSSLISGSSSSSSKTKAFFDELINVPSNRDAAALLEGRRRPRLIYIRDYPTLAPSASSWYHSLVAAVRQRRQGPISRPTSPVANATTIIFGITPSIVQPLAPAPHGGPHSMLGLMNARQSVPAIINTPAKSPKPDFGEDEHAEKAREKRLRNRLRKWERDEQAFLNDIPRLSAPSDSNGSSNENKGIVIVGGPGVSGVPALPSAFASAMQNRMGGGDDTYESTRFFRVSVLVPTVRNIAQERISRISRRRELNELTMRMGVGAVGGRLEGKLDSDVLSEPSEEAVVEGPPDRPDGFKMWDEWGKQIEYWSDVKDIADRAVGSVVAQNAAEIGSIPRNTLEPTLIPWSTVVESWTAHRSSQNVRKEWVQQSAGKFSKDQPEDDHPEAVPQQDEVIQRVKEDPELTTHEQRLLGCIIDATSMPTSFSQVHLPPHTIDSVRTIVSLPLLHPTAFQQGILKQHSMNGCLLFGPPGTGKTLVVRALAKEAGCRMLAVQPSDVMDMYVGEGEKLVRSVFSLARRLSPCVIFLDEIDALFGARSSARETGGALAHHGVITEFMQEMDGLKTNRDSNVIVIGATNRPFDLDDAVLRRLPRRLLVDLPGVKEREEILKILLRDETLADDVDIPALAKRTDLFSGSDLKHLCVSAALDAVKEGVTLPWETPSKESALLERSSQTSPPDKPAQSLDIDGAAESVENSEAGPSPSEAHEPLLPPPSDQTSTSRVLYNRHFAKALKEITPSSSESLGSLTALRKWNEEFGEGQKKKRKMMWGKGSFGFGEPGTEMPLDGRVSAS